MADLVFNQNTLESLCAKVSTLQPELSVGEYQLLLAIFAVAADHARSLGAAGEAALPEAAGSAQAADTAPDAAALQQQLLDAYVAGSSFSDVVGASGSGRVD